MNNWKIILATVVIFAAGVITGGVLVNRTLRANPPVAAKPNLPVGPLPWMARREFLFQLQRELEITPDQHLRIERTIHESQERFGELFRLIAPETQEEMKVLREAIRKELTPQQQREFEEFLRQRPRKLEPNPQDGSGQRLPPPDGNGPRFNPNRPRLPQDARPGTLRPQSPPPQPQGVPNDDQVR